MTNIEYKNIPFQCAVFSGKIGVNFYSRVKLSDLFSKFSCHKFFPEFCLSDIERENIFSVYFIPSMKTQIKWYQNKVVVSFPIQEIYNGESILYLGYPFIEYQRQKNFGVTVHAAACNVKGKGVLILGKEGSGKTSTLIHLCQNHDASLIANDLTLLELRNKTVYLIGGTKFFYLRYISTLKSLPHLISHFSKKKKTSDKWKNKIFLEPKDIGIEIEKNRIGLDKAFLVHVDETQEELLVNRKLDLSDKLYLNENFSRYIRNTTTTFLSGNNYDYRGFIPSFDNELFYLNRLKILDTILNKGELCYVSGKSLMISNYIKMNMFCNSNNNWRSSNVSFISNK